MNKKIVHDALVLFAFTVVLGLILGVVYGITKPSIDQVNYEKTQAAYKHEIVTMKQEGDRGRVKNVQSAIQNALFMLCSMLK